MRTLYSAASLTLVLPPRLAAQQTASPPAGRWKPRMSVKASVTAALAIFLAACGGSRAGAPPAPTPEAGRDLAALRDATRPFHDLSKAIAAGYPAEVSACIVHEHHGAMGYHHLNRAYVEKDISVTRPQFLLYERLADGTYRLNGVEFIIPYRFWPRDSTPPVFMGQRMKPEDSFNYWYLHVWAWTANPEGLFADFHPAVRCEDEGRTVYKPNPPAL